MEIKSRPIKNNYGQCYANQSINFGALQRTFVILKPDAFERNLAGYAEKRLGDLNFKVTKSWTGTADREKIEGHCIKKKGKDFFDDLVNFLTSGPIKVMVIEGEDAILRVRQFVENFRATYAPCERRKNLMHASDSVVEAEREIKNFFGE